MIKVLHTADWHLGQKFLTIDRIEEQRLFLDWLYGIIETQEVDLLIIAGDVFDVANPPTEANQLYYNFLSRLPSTACKQVIVVSGNHDSPNHLDAPREVLSALNVRVVGNAAGFDEIVEKELIFYPNREHPMWVVGAVPYLREQDVRRAQSGESFGEAEQKVLDGIKKHYHILAEYIDKHQLQKNIPCIVTGHLFAQGGTVSIKEGEIEKMADRAIHYVGKLGQVPVSTFCPDIFHYVALGHLHRPHSVDTAKKVQYAGSPIALSFSERDEQKSVSLLTFEGAQLTQFERLPTPISKRLIRISGSYDEVMAKVKQFECEHYTGNLYPTIVEVRTESYMEIQKKMLKAEFNGHKFLQLLEEPRFVTRKSFQHLKSSELALQQLEPLQIFESLCKYEKFDIQAQPAVLATFIEIAEEAQQNLRAISD